jgi:hypothetical protein
MNKFIHWNFLLTISFESEDYELKFEPRQSLTLLKHKILLKNLKLISYHNENKLHLHYIDHSVNAA